MASFLLYGPRETVSSLLVPVAFATCSSAATIPVSLERAKHLTRDENTASFVIPLCANLHIPSVSIHFVICAIAVMMLVGKAIGWF